MQNKKIIYETLSDIGEEWMLNLICLSDGNSYLISKNPKVQNNMKKLFNKRFENDIMQLDNVWLRKEIMKLGIENLNDYEPL